MRALTVTLTAKNVPLANPKKNCVSQRIALDMISSPPKLITIVSLYIYHVCATLAGMSNPERKPDAVLYPVVLAFGIGSWIITSAGLHVLAKLVIRFTRWWYST
jgi:hypothetical protein